MMGPETNVRAEEDIDAYRPPSRSVKYSHLIKGAATGVESLARRSSRELLESPQVRDAQAQKIQHYDLSITGSYTMASQAKHDSTMLQLQPDYIQDNQRQSLDDASTKARDADSKAQHLCNNYSRVLLIMGEKLYELDELVTAHKKKSSLKPFRRALASLFRDIHRYYSLLLAVITLLESDDLHERVQELGSLDTNQFAAFDYEQVESTDAAISTKLLMRWFATNGRIHKALKVVEMHLKSIRKEGLSVGELDLSGDGFDKVDEAATMCLERVDAAKEFLTRFDIHSAATTVLAAVRWKKKSPTNTLRRKLHQF